jgi:hypothetical protein
VQRWVKWTYDEVPAAYRALFAAGGHHDLAIAAVHKTRALRMISLDSGVPEEVAAGRVLHGGVGFEMTDLQRNDVRYCSIAFEAFPNDEETAAAFDVVVAGFLEELTDALDVDASMSYPEWLRG